jgi:undecaprenyl-diphosphatase
MDARLYRSINRFADRTSWAHGIARLYAKDGIVLFAVLLVVGLLLARRVCDSRMFAGVVCTGGSALLAVGMAQVVGNAVDRARPYTVMPTAHLLVARTADFSFPSDHATAVGAVAGGLLLVHRRLGIVAAVGAVLMAFARVYVGAHYPGDVVAGLLLGATLAALVWVVARGVVARIVEGLRGTALRSLVCATR